MVKWEAVIEDKNSGGIRIRDLGRMNQALGEKFGLENDRRGKGLVDRGYTKKIHKKEEV